MNKYQEIINSWINGQKKQMYEQYTKLTESQKIKFNIFIIENMGIEDFKGITNNILAQQLYKK